MANIANINNGEDGLSVRNKLNALIDRANTDMVITVDIDLTTNKTYTILPQEAGKLFVPNSIIAVVTELTGTISASTVFTFSSLTGWSVANSLRLIYVDTLKQITYIIDESYDSRTAIDLNSADWTVSNDIASGATSHKIKLIVKGVKIDYTPAS